MESGTYKRVHSHPPLSVIREGSPEELLPDPAPGMMSLCWSKTENLFKTSAKLSGPSWWCFATESCVGISVGFFSPREQGLCYFLYQMERRGTEPAPDKDLSSACVTIDPYLHRDTTHWLLPHITGGPSRSGCDRTWIICEGHLRMKK